MYVIQQRVANIFLLQAHFKELQTVWFMLEKVIFLNLLCSLYMICLL